MWRLALHCSDTDAPEEPDVEDHALPVVRRLWVALSGDESAEQCGWLKDRFGLSWQIIPRTLPRLLNDADPDAAKRVMEAMLAMKKLDVATLERAAEPVDAST